MNVAIIGGGAVGLLVASYLKLAEFTPLIYTKRKEQSIYLEEYGIDFIKADKKMNFKVEAHPFADGIKKDVDLLVVAVKQYSLEAIIDYLVIHKCKTPILFLQNGMSHITYLSKLSSAGIYVGVVEHGVLKQSDCSIIHTGEGQIRIGAYSGNVGDLDDIWKALNSVGFRVTIEKDWYGTLTQKLIVNAVINPLTALYKIKNGQLIDNPAYFDNMRLVFDEVIQPFHLPDTERLWEHVVMVCRNTGENYSSMHRDIKQNRETEIDSILGYIIEVGNEKQVPMPLSLFLYKSIKGMENMREEEGNG